MTQTKGTEKCEPCIDKSDILKLFSQILKAN